MSEAELERRAFAHIGRVLREKYRLDRLLGVGGMASVYAAEHRNGRRVAVKLLHPELSLNREVRERFLREGLVANRVGHPGAVAVLDDDVCESGEAFLVMELLEGATLEKLSELGVLPIPALCTVARDLLDVLIAAHGHGIVHRDLKPANLFVTNAGQLKVLDFGIARLLEAGTARATQTGMLLGTPDFMAPEQALGRVNQIDARTDLWAVGATLFTLASRQSVHVAETAQETMVLAATVRARSLASVCGGAPPELVAAVDLALAFDAGDRWASAAIMRDAFEQLCGTWDPQGDALALLMRRAQHALPSATRTGTGSVASRQHSPQSAAPNELRLTAARLPRASKVAIAALLLGGLLALWLFQTLRASASSKSERPTATTAAVSETLQASIPAPVPLGVPSAIQRSPEVLASAVTTHRQQVGSSPARSEPVSTVATMPAAPPTPAAAVPRAAATTTPTGLQCNPPYVRDSSGNKRWKRECL